MGLRWLPKLAALTCVIFVHADITYKGTTYGTADLVGRFRDSDAPMLGQPLGYKNKQPLANSEAKMVFVAPDVGIDAIFEEYQGPDGTEANCLKILEKVGVAPKTFKAKYEANTTVPYYILMSKVGLQAATWDNVPTLVGGLYAGFDPAPSFNLTQVLADYLPSLKNWSAVVKQNGDGGFVSNLIVSDLDGDTFQNLTIGYRPSTVEFFSLSDPSAEATRTWLAISMGMNENFLGTGETLNGADAGVKEALVPNKLVTAEDVVLTLECDDMVVFDRLVVVATVLDESRLFIDGVLKSGFQRKAAQQDFVSVPMDTRVIFVHARFDVNTPGDRGRILVSILGKEDTGLGWANATWRCKTGFEAEWVHPEFSATSWPVATSAPWAEAEPQLRTEHLDSSQWIWTADPTAPEVSCVLALPAAYQPTAAPQESEVRIEIKERRVPGPWGWYFVAGIGAGLVIGGLVALCIFRCMLKNMCSGLGDCFSRFG